MMSRGVHLAVWGAVAIFLVSNSAACGQDEAAQGTEGDCRNMALACSPGFVCELVPTDGQWTCVPEDPSGGPSFNTDISSGSPADAGADAGPRIGPADVVDDGGPPVVDIVEDAGGGEPDVADPVDVPDVPPPLLTVAVTLPGPYLSGVAVVEATVGGPSGVLGVEFQVDGVPVHTDVIPPYSAAIDTGSWEPGEHTLRAATASADGQTAAAEATAIFDNDPPVIESFLPEEGATLFFEDGAIGLSAEVNDAAPVASVTFRVNGLLVGEASAPPWAASVEPSALLLTADQLPKALEVSVQAVDAQGQESEALHTVVVHRRLIWSLETPGEVWTPVAPLGDALIATTLDGHVLGIGADGGQTFALDLQKELAIGPVADQASGRFFVCGTDGYVRAYDAGGGEGWSVNVGGACGGTPAVHGGQLVVPVTGGDVVGLSVSDGGQQWKASLPGLISASPAVAADGTVYIGSQDGSLYALNGSEVSWSHPTGGEIWSRPAVGPAPEDGAGQPVYVGSNDGWVYALGAGGDLQWQAEVKGQVWGTLLAPGDGAVYVASTFKQVYSLSADDGAVLWTTKVGGLSYSSPVLDPDGTLYIGSTTGVLHALDAVTGDQRFAFETGASLHATPLLVGDRLYVGCIDKSVYALWRYGVALP